MSEYIDRAVAVSQAAFIHGRWDDMYVSAATLMEIPAADVEPVVHGQWLKEEKETYCPVQYREDGEPILHKYTRYTCSVCGRNSGMLEPYCHCGAKMDRGVKDDD